MGENKFAIFAFLFVFALFSFLNVYHTHQADILSFESDEKIRFLNEQNLNLIREQKSIQQELARYKKSPAADITEKNVELSEAEIKKIVSFQNTRYWLDSKQTWPTERLQPKSKYITFTPWHGGFNNIRMSLEMALALSYALNRTLVLPPVFKLYLRGTSDLMDYFDFDDLNKGFSVLQYDEFIEKHKNFRKAQNKYGFPSEVVHSKVEQYYEGLKDLSKGDVYFIDENRIGKGTIGGDILFCVPTCPQSSTLRKDVTKKQINWFNNFAKNKRHQFDTSDSELQAAEIVHLPHNLLGHFYTIVYFEDKRRQQRMIQLIKDHVHFKEEIFTLAEKVVDALNGASQFSCLHVRRNEFQFDHVRIDAELIKTNIEGMLDQGETLYIATDEIDKKASGDKHHVSMDPTAMTKKRNHTWFWPLIERYGTDKVFFLDDFFDHLLRDTPKIWIGCIESIICSRSRLFVGTRLSTFSGYINRLRGYMNDIRQELVLDISAKYPTDYYHFLKGPSWSQYPSGSYGGSHPSWGKEYAEGWQGAFEPVS